ncbi:unnamed protein product [Vitrella brassicaformis CCMP3155]|uniref:C3H1-type domain-containing protein n=2 Tax=Vitrella brassicaformis TaxID=1169539 RepID=A0A0G4EU82_VITBC|nr:unnamed protein product [Vitrella brassicaformis CCMP3155]|eukprot:CEM01837.1 unnamed protein product [Vitrella brassicaformis CCMP3155]
MESEGDRQRRLQGRPPDTPHDDVRDGSAAPDVQEEPARDESSGMDDPPVSGASEPPPAPRQQAAEMGFGRKTALCKYWAPHWSKNRCIYGRDCYFAHGEDELRLPTHLPKTKLCPVFLKTGECSKGRSCPLAHGDQERHDVREMSDEPCRFFLEGRCNRGSMCRYYHDTADKPKTGRGPILGDFVPTAYYRSRRR